MAIEKWKNDRGLEKQNNSEAFENETIMAMSSWKSRGLKSGLQVAPSGVLGEQLIDQKLKLKYIQRKKGGQKIIGNWTINSQGSNK